MIPKHCTIITSNPSKFLLQAYFDILIKLISACAVSYFCRRKWTQVKSEKSSTITRIFFFPVIGLIIEEAHKSICTSSSVSTIFELIFIGYPCWCYFSCSQASHKDSISKLSTGKPRTKSSRTSLIRFWNLSEKVIIHTSNLDQKRPSIVNKLKVKE